MLGYEQEQVKWEAMCDEPGTEDLIVRSKDRSIVMTFDGQGELVDMKFTGSAFRSMAPAQLARLIVTTVQSGRTEFAARSNAHGSPADKESRPGNRLAAPKSPASVFGDEPAEHDVDGVFGRQQTTE